MFKDLFKETTSLGLAVALVAAFAAPTDLGAETPQYRRKSPKVPIEVVQTDRTTKLSEREKRGKKPTQPKLTAKRFLDVSERVGEFRQSQRRKLEKLIAATDRDDPDLPGLYFRLAESFAAEQRFHRLRRYHALESKRRKRAAEHAKKEKTALENAIRTYAALASSKRFRRYKRMDQVLFFYAYTLRDANRIGLARTVYKQLIQDHPQSKYVPNAYLSFADDFFEREDLERAEQFYDKVLEFPKASIYAYALYKLGWVYLNQDRNQEALATFFKLANLTRRDEKRRVLHKAAKRDFVRAYAVVGKPKRALAAFQRLDKKDAFRLLGVLGSVYFDQGQARKAIYTFRELLARQPKDPRVCEWQYHVQQAMLSIGSKADVAAETIKLGALYAAVKKRKLVKGAQLSECRDNARAVTGELAKLWHVEANRTKDEKTFLRAIELYQSYVARFSEADDVGELHFHAADANWALAELGSGRVASRRWEKAAEEFTKVLERPRLSRVLRREAAYAAALAWKNALKVDPATVVPRPEEVAEGETPQPMKIGRRYRKLMTALATYRKQLGSKRQSERVAMKFLEARILWRHDHLERANPMFRDIAFNHPTHETALFSANILLNNLIRLKRDDELARVAKKMLGNKALLAGRKELESRLAIVRIKTMRLAAERLEAEKKWLECGHAYFDIFNASGKAKGLDEVLYNAGFCFERAKSLGFAISMYRQLREQFPGSPHSEKALVRMGDAFGSIASYRKAAEYFEEYAKKYGGEELAPKAISQAVAFRRGIGDDKSAIRNTELYVRRYGRTNKREAAEALFSMTSIYEKQGKTKKVIAHLKRYLKQAGASGGRGRRVWANGKLGELLWRSSCRGELVAGACVRVARQRSLRRRHKRRHGSAIPKRCGEEDRAVVTVLSRDKRRASEARRYLSRAVSEWDKGTGEIEGELKATAAHWAMAARFYLADQKYEGYLRIRFPEKLDFNPAKPALIRKSSRRFLAWTEAKSKAGAAVAEAYRKVLNGKSPHWAIAAAARMGQIPQSAADALYRAEVPAHVRTGPFAEEGYFEYCGRLEEVAAPLEARSVAAFSFCLEETTKRNWWSPWAKLCETELGAINGRDYPPADEVHGRVDAAGAVTDTSPVIAHVNE